MRAFRLFPFTSADGPRNMAADEALLHAAAAHGAPSLRLYGWIPATVSLGYFQPAAVRLQDPRLAKLPWVRRPSGGKTLVHHHEVTYALALPPEFSRGDWVTRMHRRVIVPALEALGVPVGRLRLVEREPRLLGDVLCFQQQTPGDVLCDGHKIVGSAQRKQRQSILQHGGMLLSASAHVPELRGVEDLAGIALQATDVADAVASALCNETGWYAADGRWTPEEQALADELAAKYASPAWNEKR